MAEELSLKEKILLIERKVVDLTTTADLWGVSHFIEISENGNEYLDDAFGLVTGDDLTTQQKVILLYSLQKTDIDYYKYFLKNIAVLFKQNKIEEIIIFQAFGYMAEWSYHVIENYRDPIVQEAIDLCLEKETISDKLEDWLKDIRTGRSWRRMRRNVNK
jgi:hypothetical protein